MLGFVKYFCYSVRMQHMDGTVMALTFTIEVRFRYSRHLSETEYWIKVLNKSTLQDTVLQI